MFAFGWSSCGRKPECPEETHLPDLVTTSDVDAGYRTRVAVVRGECVNIALARQSQLLYNTPFERKYAQLLFNETIYRFNLFQKLGTPIVMILKTAQSSLFLNQSKCIVVNLNVNVHYFCLINMCYVNGMVIADSAK